MTCSGRSGLGQAGQGTAWFGVARPGPVRLDMAPLFLGPSGLGSEWPRMARLGPAVAGYGLAPLPWAWRGSPAALTWLDRRGAVRQGQARFGRSRRGRASPGMSWLGAVALGRAIHGAAWQMARRGRTRLVQVWLPYPGESGHDVAWYGESRLVKA